MISNIYIKKGTDFYLKDEEIGKACSMYEIDMKLQF